MPSNSKGVNMMSLVTVILSKYFRFAITVINRSLSMHDDIAYFGRSGFCLNCYIKLLLLLFLFLLKLPYKIIVVVDVVVVAAAVFAVLNVIIIPIFCHRT